jgi:uncharacterized protein involved in exopolysaccharide biosynthesis
MADLPIKVPEGFVLEPVKQNDIARETLSVVFKWKWLIAGALLAVIVPVVISAFSAEPTYRATARTIVKQDRVYLSLTPGEENRDIRVPVSRATINSELRVLRSREVMEKVVNQLDPSVLAAAGADDAEDAALWLQNKLDLNPIPDSNIIEISYTSADPERAVLIVNKVAEAYQERHAEITRPQNAYQFFERQAANYLERLREAERRLKDFEREEGVIDLTKETAETRTVIERLERELQATLVQIGEEETRLGFLKEEIKKHPVRIDTAEETVPNRTAELLRTRLIQLEHEKKALLQLYTEKDRRVIGKDEEIEAARRSLAAEESYVTGRKETDLNLIRRTLEQDFVSGQARLTSLLAKKRTLSAQVDQARSRFVRLDNGSSKYNELKKSFEIAQQNYTLFHKRSEEAQISEAMDREKLLNVGILERAALPLQPIRDSKKTTILLSVFAGLALGLGLVFGFEFFNTSVRSEKLLEEQLNLPVLATIERYPAR